MDDWFDIVDIPFYLNCMIQLISFIYITKKCFVGKCSIIRNIFHFIFCIMLLPILSFFEMMIVMEFIPIPSFVLQYMSSISGAMILLASCQMVILAIVTVIYSLYCGKKNRTIAAFTYLMFYMIGLFGLSLSFTETTSMALIILNIIVVCFIQFLFCYQILPQIVSITKENREVNKIEFYLLPSLYILLGYFLLGCELDDLESDVSITLTAIFIFLEFLVLITFRYTLKNLSQINEISNQNEKLEIAKNDIKTLSVEVMKALAHTIDAKDEYTRGHSVRVAKYSRMLAERLHLSSEECENVYYMALLHDIGKIGVPNEIINSTTRLTDEEYAVIKTHPSLGYDILAEIKSRPDLSTGARWHHERFDGKGYPDGKKGEEIPFSARIIAVADSYDAMTSNRSYRKYMPQDKVRLEIEKNIGTQFDPEVSKCMLAMIDEDVNYELHE